MIRWLLLGGNIDEAVRQVRAMFIAPQVALIFVAAGISRAEIEKMNSENKFSFVSAIQMAYFFIQPRMAKELANGFLRSYKQIERGKNEGYFYHLLAAFSFAAAATDKKSERALRQHIGKLSEADKSSDQIVFAIAANFERYEHTIFDELARY
jgi:hypothetical protein